MYGSFEGFNEYTQNAVMLLQLNILVDLFYYNEYLF